MYFTCIVGYTFGFKGYKLYDSTTKRIFRSRDVIFSESMFPFKRNPQVAPLDPKVLDYILPSFEPYYAAFNFDPPPSPHISSSLISPSTSSQSLSILPQLSNPFSTYSLNSLESSALVAYSASPTHSSSNTASHISPDTTPPIRKSQRVTGPPAWMTDLIRP